MLTEELPDADAGLVFTGDEVRMVVPEGLALSVPTQGTVAPAARPETVAVTKTDVCRDVLSGTGTTLGETVTEVTAWACALVAGSRMNAQNVSARISLSVRVADIVLHSAEAVGAQVMGHAARKLYRAQSYAASTELRPPNHRRLSRGSR